MRHSLATGLVLALAGGCVPSFRMVHEGNGYFETCYAADYDAGLRDGQREACWHAWLAHYTRHQPAHRIDYAMGRLEALELGEPPPALPGLGPPSAPSGQALTAPPRQALVLQSSPPSQPPVEHGCATTCDARRERCMTHCEVRLGPCEKACEHERAICRGGCY